jgi:hypothetical protein
VLATLTAAVTLFQNVEHTVVTTAQDVIGAASPPVTYAELEALRTTKTWR